MSKKQIWTDFYRAITINDDVLEYLYNQIILYEDNEEISKILQEDLIECFESQQTHPNFNIFINISKKLMVCINSKTRHFGVSFTKHLANKMQDKDLSIVRDLLTSTIVPLLINHLYDDPEIKSMAKVLFSIKCGFQSSNYIKTNTGIVLEFLKSIMKYTVDSENNEIQNYVLDSSSKDIIKHNNSA